MNEYITSEEAKEILKRVRTGDLDPLSAREALLKCFFTIRQMLPILNERAAMDCVCLNVDVCSCGKVQSARIVRAVKAAPRRRTNRATGQWS